MISLLVTVGTFFLKDAFSNLKPPKRTFTKGIDQKTIYQYQIEAMKNTQREVDKLVQSSEFKEKYPVLLKRRAAFVREGQHNQSAFTQP